MNKKLLLTILVIVIVIGSAMAYVLMKKDSTPESQPTATTDTEKKDLPETSQPTSEASREGSYVEYSEESFAKTQGTRLLFFHAPWCPQCRALDGSIKESTLPSDLTIFKVDYDSNQTLRAKYGVTIQTTVVRVDEKGNKINSYVAYDEPTFESVKRALLP